MTCNSNHATIIFSRKPVRLFDRRSIYHLSLEDDAQAQTANCALTAFLRLTRSEKGVVVAGLDEFKAGSLDLLSSNDGTKPFPERVRRIDRQQHDDKRR